MIAVHKAAHGYFPTKRCLSAELLAAKYEPLALASPKVKRGCTKEFNGKKKYLMYAIAKLSGTKGQRSHENGMRRDCYGVKPGYKPAENDEVPFYERHMQDAAEAMSSCIAK